MDISLNIFIFIFIFGLYTREVVHIMLPQFYSRPFLCFVRDCRVQPWVTRGVTLNIYNPVSPNLLQSVSLPLCSTVSVTSILSLLNKHRLNKIRNQRRTKDKIRTTFNPP